MMCTYIKKKEERTRETVIGVGKHTGPNLSKRFLTCARSGVKEKKS